MSMGVSRRVVTAVILGVVIGTAGTTIARASHRFGDVPDTNVFHEDIEWLAGLGVTRGCNPPANDEFCPQEPVSRAQMAAFLRRYDTSTSARAGRFDGTRSQVMADGEITVLGTSAIFVPADGGMVSMISSASLGSPSFVEWADGFTWFEFDGGDTCNPLGGATGLAMFSTFAGLEETTGIWATPAAKGMHSIKLCGVGLGEDIDVYAVNIWQEWLPGQAYSSLIGYLAVEDDAVPSVDELVERLTALSDARSPDGR